MLNRSHSRRRAGLQRGFALVEALLVVALTALISAHAMSPIAHTRRVTSEQRVRAVLRELHTAQAQRLGATGEFGYFAELDLGPGFTLHADDLVARDGYAFAVWIADEQLVGLSAEEDRTRTGPRLPYYAIVAWPLSASDWRGRTVYFLNESGQVAAMANRPAAGVRTTTPQWYAGYLEPAMDARSLAMTYVGADGLAWELLP